MNLRQLIVSIAIIMLSTLALYLLIAYNLLQDPDPEALQTESGAASNTSRIAPNESGSIAPAIPGVASQTTARQSEQRGGRKMLEIFGRVFDNDGQPIENVLVAEERYFSSTRSESDGSYRLMLELPRHRYPTLHFLRRGYDGQRFRLDQKELQQAPIYELDVNLDDALESVNLQGWVGNENGIGLEGARIELSASYTRNRDSFYLTDFSDVNGNFEFEGVRSGETYRFSVSLAPEYPYYEDLDFRVTQNPAQINIVLDKLSFVDIDGMILDRSSTPVPNYEMFISNLTTGTHSRKIVSDTSGFFTLRNFPLGEISLTTRGAEFFTISGLEITDDQYQNLKLIVDRGNHYLSGWISDPSGIAVNNAMVTLDRKFRQGEIEHSSYRSQRTDLNGGFAFGNLGDGEYHVTVYAQGYQKQEFDYRFNGQSGEVFVAMKRN